MMDFKEAYKQALLLTFDFTAKFLDDHNLHWWGAYGTCIGAIRHQGLIPWDDDIDIYMLRSDYNKLLSLQGEIQKYGYDLLSAHNGKNSMFYTKISNQHTTLVAEAEEPLDVGVFIDVFPLDYLDGDVSEFDSNYKALKKWTGLHKYLYFRVTLGDIIRTLKSDRSKALRYLYSLLSPRFLKMWTKAKVEDVERRLSSTNHGDYLVSYFGPYGRKEILKSEWFDDFELMDYEGRKIKVPKHCADYLRQIYGDFMKPPAVIPETTHCQYYVNLKEKVDLNEVRHYVKKGLTRVY